MAEPKDIPFAEFFEEMLELLVEHGAEAVCVSAILPDGSVATGFHGATVNDKVLMAHYLYASAMRDTEGAYRPDGNDPDREEDGDET